MTYIPYIPLTIILNSSSIHYTIFTKANVELKMDEFNPFVVFEAKLDKDRGIIILTIRKQENDNVCFFRFHHQPITCHPEQVQQIIRSNKVTARTKSIKVNVFSFLSHYWNESGQCFEFKGIKLNSTAQQTATIQSARINKEIVLLKRQHTGTGTKQQKHKEKMDTLAKKLQEEETLFQIKRAERIAEVKADFAKSATQNAKMDSN